MKFSIEHFDITNEGKIKEKPIFKLESNVNELVIVGKEKEEPKTEEKKPKRKEEKKVTSKIDKKNIKPKKEEEKKEESEESVIQEMY